MFGLQPATNASPILIGVLAFLAGMIIFFVLRVLRGNLGCLVQLGIAILFGLGIYLVLHAALG
jgi:hypothetical protein